MLNYTKDDIKLVYIDSYKRYYYLLLVDFIVDYEKQVFITGIKTNMQCSICHILLKKKS